MTTSAPSVSSGNWTPFVQDIVNGKSTASFIVSIDTAKPDPARDCAKDFSASYQCGSSPTVKTVFLPSEALGKTAIFDCSSEKEMCKGLRLTLGDDGSLVLSDADNKQVWTSNTNKIGLVVDKFNAKNGKYGRNYLLAGESLSLGEFIGSPSGNCYLIMDKTPDGDGNTLQLKYSVTNCTNEQYGVDEDTNGLFSLAKSAYNELTKTTNNVTPNMKRLDKTMNKEEDNFAQQKNIMSENIAQQKNIRKMKPIISRQTQQLDAMNEDRELFLVRYEYRRIAWFTLAILIVLAGVKMARSS
jgi:hypothetical protein